MNRRSLLVAALTTGVPATRNEPRDIESAGAENSSRRVDGEISAVAADVFDFIPKELQEQVLSGQSTSDLSIYLQAAHDAHRHVCYRPGTYRISSSIALRSGASAVGSGYGTRIKLLGNVGDVSVFTNSNPAPTDNSSRDWGVSIRDLVLDGDRQHNNSATEQSHGIILRAVRDAVIDAWAENFKGDGVMIMYAKGANQIVSEGVRVSLRTVNCMRNGLSVVGVNGLIFDVLSQNSGMCGVDLENDSGDDGVSLIRNVIGRVIDRQSGRDFGRGYGYSFLADGNGGILDNVIVDVVSENHAYSGVGYRCATNTTIRAQIRNPAAHGIVGVDGTNSPSHVALDFVVSGAGQRGLSDRTTPGGGLDITRGVIHGGGDVTYIEGKTRGVLSGLHIEPHGLRLKDCSNLLINAPHLTGSVGLQLEGQCAENTFVGGVISGSFAGIIEKSPSNGNNFNHPELTGPALVSGKDSTLVTAPFKATASWRPGPVTHGASVTTTFTAPKAALGDLVIASFSRNLQGLSLTAYVAAPGHVAAVLANSSGRSVDIGEGDLMVSVQQSR